jgi:hypothetical protein
LWCREKVSETFIEMQQRAIEQNRWESADRFQMGARMYGPDWAIHPFLWRHAATAAIAEWAWKKRRNGKFEECRWEYDSHFQGGVGRIYNCIH